MSNIGTGPVVSFENVSKQYGSLKAVDGLSLDLRPGETVALLGPNGAGKSTSLDMLLALRKPTSGRIRMFGSDPYHAIKSGRVGAMLQSGGLMPEVTVRELVSLVASLHPRPVPVDTTLKRAGIDSFAEQRVDKLSGGQTQRVRFALAIAGECELIVLDEPTTAMDVETRRLFWANMKAEVAEGRTLLFATHYLEEADQAADRILVINKGRLLADGTPAEIKERAGAKRMSFRLERVDEPFLLGLPGLESLEIRHDVVQIQTSDSDATLYAVLDAGYRPTEIEVSSLGLEQAFIAITAEDDRAGGPARVRGTPPREPREGDERPMSGTSGTVALAKAEIIRLRRNKRYLFFTLALPIVLYLSLAKTAVTEGGVPFKIYYLFEMASLGAFSGAFNNNAIRISQERKDGWIRQLRLTCLPANSYVVAKIIATVALTAPQIAIMMLLGRFYGGIELPIWQWTVIALAIWLGTLIFAALAVAIGYWMNPNSVQPVIMIIFLFFSLFGGLWFPVTGGLKTFAQGTPTYRIVQIATDVTKYGTVSWTAVGVILIWLAVFVGLATFAVRNAAEAI